MSFSDDIKRFTGKTEKSVEMVFRGTALDVISKIMQRSPVKTGRFRGDWQTTLNMPASGVIEGTASNSLNKARSVSGSAKLTDAIYYINNLPYSLRLENGYSKQAPAGMVKLTVSEFQRIASDNARRNQ